MTTESPCESRDLARPPPARPAGSPGGAAERGMDEKPQVENPLAAEPLGQEGLVRQNIGWLQGWLRGRVDDPELVHDLSQEAFLKTFRNLGQLRDPKRFSGWLFRTAQNLLRDQLRSKRRQRTHLATTESLDRIAATGSGLTLEQKEDAARVLEAVRELPERYREPFLLRHSQDLSYDEISNLLGIERGAVRVRMHRARQMLRDRFDGVSP
jgi:RNA polymerase sigma-70 factor (ECF subfamily)